jgi:hypothetical protein
MQGCGNNPYKNHPVVHIDGVLHLVAKTCDVAGCEQITIPETYTVDDEIHYYTKCKQHMHDDSDSDWVSPSAEKQSAKRKVEDIAVDADAKPDAEKPKAVEQDDADEMGVFMHDMCFLPVRKHPRSSDNLDALVPLIAAQERTEAGIRTLLSDLAPYNPETRKVGPVHGKIHSIQVKVEDFAKQTTEDFDGLYRRVTNLSVEMGEIHAMLYNLTKTIDQYYGHN